MVIIADINTPDQIPQLMTEFTDSPFYRQFRSTRKEDIEQYSVSAVYHLCGEEVLEDARYKEFMNGFPDTLPEETVRQPGVFGPVVAPPPDASTTEQLIARCGRQPRQVS